MNGTRGTNETATAGNGGGLDPGEAATLIEQTKGQPRRQFDRMYPATAPLIIGGGFAAGTSAVREDWPALVTALAAVAAGAVSAFAGPVWVRAIAGVGLFVALLGNAVVTARPHRA
jgi:hypothetical protein